MRKVGIIMLLILMLFLSSCSFEISHLSDKLIIEAIGIDKNENEWEITVQILDTKQSGSSGDTQSNENITQTYKSHGETIAEAMDMLMIKTGQETLYSQTRVLVIGKKVAKDDMSKFLDYFIREYTTRDDTLVVIADETAGDIVSAQLGESTIGAKIIQKEIEIGSSNGICVKMPVYKLVNLLLGETDAAYVPIIKKEKTDDDKDMLVIGGTAVISDFSIKTILDNKQTTGLLLLNDLIENCVISLELDNDVKAAVEIIKCETRIKMEKDGKKINAGIQSKLSCDIIEFSNEYFGELTAQNIEQIKMETEKAVIKLMTDAYDKAVKKNACDIVRLGRRLWREYPEDYSDYLTNRDKALKGINENISADVIIRRAGKETQEK